jgi:hypothetical protein
MVYNQEIGLIYLYVIRLDLKPIVFNCSFTKFIFRSVIPRACFDLITTF